MDSTALIIAVVTGAVIASIVILSFSVVAQHRARVRGEKAGWKECRQFIEDNYTLTPKP